MLCADIPHNSQYDRKTYRLELLLDRVTSAMQTGGRALWKDLTKEPGIYVVRWTYNRPPGFSDTPGRAAYAHPAAPRLLAQKWCQITRRSQTDIIYIGKGDCLRERIRLLVRFGAGKRAYHEGGEWMWQVQDIESSELMVETCPPGKELGFEKALLLMFRKQHGDWPLANRQEPQWAVEPWLP